MITRDRTPTKKDFSIWRNNIKILHKKYNVALFIACLIIFILTRFLLDMIGLESSTLNTIFDSLIATSIVMIIVHYTLNVTRLPNPQTEWTEVSPKKIGYLLQKAANETHEWSYIGNTGGYVRNKIYPAFMKQATQNNKHIKVRIMILDPNNEKLCAAYAKYRKDNRSNQTSQTKWDCQQVQAQLVATSIKTIQLDNSSRFITCELAFSNCYSQFRYDISSDEMIVTLEDPQESAFLYPRDSNLFNQHKAECEIKWEQAEKQEMEELPIIKDITKADIESYINKHFHKMDAKKIASMVLDILDDDRCLYNG